MLNTRLAKPMTSNQPSRSPAEPRWLLVSDLDDTLTGDDAAETWADLPKTEAASRLAACIADHLEGAP